MENREYRISLLYKKEKSICLFLQKKNGGILRRSEGVRDGSEGSLKITF